MCVCVCVFTCRKLVANKRSAQISSTHLPQAVVCTAIYNPECRTKRDYKTEKRHQQKHKRSRLTTNVLSFHDVIHHQDNKDVIPIAWYLTISIAPLLMCYFAGEVFYKEIACNRYTLSYQCSCTLISSLSVDACRQMNCDRLKHWVIRVSMSQQLN